MKVIGPSLIGPSRVKMTQVCACEIRDWCFVLLKVIGPSLSLTGLKQLGVCGVSPLQSQFSYCWTTCVIGQLPEAHLLMHGANVCSDQWWACSAGVSDVSTTGGFLRHPKQMWSVHVCQTCMMEQHYYLLVYIELTCSCNFKWHWPCFKVTAVSNSLNWKSYVNTGRFLPD